MRAIVGLMCAGFIALALACGGAPNSTTRVVIVRPESTTADAPLAPVAEKSIEEKPAPAVEPAKPQPLVAAETPPTSPEPATTPPPEPVDPPAAVPSSPKVRRWTSADRAFSVEAEFLSKLGDLVKLRRIDTSEVISVPVNRLCDDDLAWLESYRPAPTPIAAKPRKSEPKVEPAEPVRFIPEPSDTPTYSSSSGSVQVKGYYRKDGTYVKPHTRSAPRR